MNTSSPLIIIGTGLAGFNLAKEFRKLNHTHELILITEDDGHFYSKPQLSTAISQEKSPEQLIITSAEKMQSQLNATLYTYTRVIAIDPCLHTITLKNADSTFTLCYHTLVLATGATPKPFPLLEGFANHYRVNTLQDYDRFIQENQNIENCTIIGSGLVGCEFAHDLSHRVPAIKVITPDPHPLYGLVPACIGNSLQAVLTDRGIQWLTHTTLTEDNVVNHVLTAQCILTAIGITPSLNLAQQAGLLTKQGIVVNRYLQTSEPSIYALGDCAEIDGTCRQYVAPLLHCARALAQTLNGSPTAIAFPVFPVSLKINVYPVIAVPPPKNAPGEWEVESSNHDHQALFWDENDCLAGYALSGRYLESRQSCLMRLHSSRVACADHQ